MISLIEDTDVDVLSNIVSAAVRESIAENDEDARFLIDDIVGSLKTWQMSDSDGFRGKYCVAGETVGFVIVKQYWNLSHLFVLPDWQRRGIGRCLLQNAIQACSDRSPRGKIQLYSSISAAGFYVAMGFRQTGPGIERPGGCIPFEYAC